MAEMMTKKSEIDLMSGEGFEPAEGQESFGLGGRGYISSRESPEDILHSMKMEERERAQIRRMRRDEPMSVSSGIYDGAGGYRYDVSPQGDITIVEAPQGRGTGTKLTRGMAYDAIMEELSKSTPNVSDRLDATLADLGRDDDDADMAKPEGAMALDTRRTESADFDAMPLIDTSDGGVVSGEGRSGQEMARVEGMSNEEQVAELDRGRKVEMSPAARLAFLRTKAKNRG